MNAGYHYIIVMGLAAVLIPSVVLSVALRPRPLLNVFRGGEAAVCFASAIDAMRRLALIGSGSPIPYPGDVWAVVNLSALALVASLLWCRVAQVQRHKARDRETEIEWTRFVASSEPKENDG